MILKVPIQSRAEFQKRSMSSCTEDITFLILITVGDPSSINPHRTEALISQMPEVLLWRVPPAAPWLGTAPEECSHLPPCKVNSLLHPRSPPFKEVSHPPRAWAVWDREYLSPPTPSFRGESKGPSEFQGLLQGWWSPLHKCNKIYPSLQPVLTPFLTDFLPKSSLE